jgi:hypothetical protein
VYIFYSYFINLVVYKPTKKNWVKILLFGKKNKKATNFTNGFYEKMPKVTMFLKEFRP